MDTQTIRTITGDKIEQIIRNMPAKPYIGQRFRPDGTDSIAAVVAVTGSARKPSVSYSFMHDAPNAPVYDRPYSEVRAMSWDVATPIAYADTDSLHNG